MGKPNVPKAIEEMITAQGHIAMAIAHMELAMDHLPDIVPVGRKEGDIAAVALRDMIRSEQRTIIAHGKNLGWIERELHTHA